MPVIGPGLRDDNYVHVECILSIPSHSRVWPLRPLQLAKRHMGTLPCDDYSARASARPDPRARRPRSVFPSCVVSL
jgi:hypothetical protein